MKGDIQTIADALSCLGNGKGHAQYRVKAEESGRLWPESKPISNAGDTPEVHNFGQLLNTTVRSSTQSAAHLDNTSRVPPLEAIRDSTKWCLSTLVPYS